MKYTLLEIVQRVLESMDSDEVNTIYATPESTAVANIAKECYFDIIGDIGVREHQTLYQLVASGDDTKPIEMSLPSNAMTLERLEYNIGTLSNPEYSTLMYVDLEDFEYRQNTLIGTGTGTQVVSMTNGDFVFKYFDDRWPSIYTTIDDTVILFDAYKDTEEDTLTSSRTKCFGLVSTTFLMQDTYVPILDPRQFQLWLQATKAQAFVELKQVENAKAERKERRNWILARKTKHSVDNTPEIYKHKGFGRK